MPRFFNASDPKKTSDWGILPTRPWSFHRSALIRTNPGTGVQISPIQARIEQAIEQWSFVQILCSLAAPVQYGPMEFDDFRFSEAMNLFKTSAGNFVSAITDVLTSRFSPRRYRSRRRAEHQRTDEAVGDRDRFPTSDDGSHSPFATRVREEGVRDFPVLAHDGYHLRSTERPKAPQGCGSLPEAPGHARNPWTQIASIEGCRTLRPEVESTPIVIGATWTWMRDRDREVTSRSRRSRFPASTVSIEEAHSSFPYANLGAYERP